jgi:hypothetical protein
VKCNGATVPKANVLFAYEHVVVSKGQASHHVCGKQGLQVRFMVPEMRKDFIASEHAGRYLADTTGANVTEWLVVMHVYPPPPPGAAAGTS